MLAQALPAAAWSNVGDDPAAAPNSAAARRGEVSSEERLCSIATTSQSATQRGHKAAIVLASLARWRCLRPHCQGRDRARDGRCCEQQGTPACRARMMMRKSANCKLRVTCCELCRLVPDAPLPPAMPVLYVCLQAPYGPAHALIDSLSLPTPPCTIVSTLPGRACSADTFRMSLCTASCGGPSVATP
jgi:hypothetical protein